MTANRKVAIICSKAGLDECYPALILANAARQSGIDAFVFFTFLGLDVITEEKVDHLHVNLAGNPASGMPTMLACLPGMESLAGRMMRKQMTELSLPKIGHAFGGRYHTTVMHADRKIRELMRERRSIYNQVTELTNRIRHRSS